VAFFHRFREAVDLSDNGGGVHRQHVACYREEK
jgi:hypothetical protein